MTGAPYRPRVALVMPYWDFFEAASGVDLRTDRLELFADAAGQVSESADVVARVVLDAADQVPAAAEQVVGARTDVLLLVVTMACPPQATGELLAALPEVPVVVWACDRPAVVTSGFSHSEIVLHGSSVGTPMITSDLVTRGRAFSLVDGAPGSDRARSEVAAALLGAAAATHVRRARIARLGQPMPGYTSVSDSDERLHDSLGLRVVSLPASALAVAADNVTDSELDSWRSRRSVDYDWDEGLDATTTSRAIRAVIALDRLMTEHALDAGTLDCHTRDIRGCAPIGQAPCLALGDATSSGRPWTCTGDILTSIAMLIGSLVAASSLYHEVEAYDPAGDDWILANSGEHDLRWTDKRPSVGPNPWWPEGVSARHPLTAGPATMLALRRSETGHRLVVAEGAVGIEPVPGTGTAGGRFAFSGDDGRGAWRAWVMAGAGHHSCLVRGHAASILRETARHLRIECLVTTPDPPAVNT